MLQNPMRRANNTGFCSRLTASLRVFTVRVVSWKTESNTLAGYIWEGPCSLDVPDSIEVMDGRSECDLLLLVKTNSRRSMSLASSTSLSS